MMTELEEYIYKYHQYIELFHRALKAAFNLEIEPTYNEAGRLFPRQGEFSFEGRKFTYRYHGNGCTLMIGDVIVDYDLDIFDRSYIEITSWKFYRFIESSSNNKSNILLDNLSSLFVELSLKGALIRKYPDRFVFLINKQPLRQNWTFAPADTF